MIGKSNKMVEEDKTNFEKMMNSLGVDIDDLERYECKHCGTKILSNSYIDICAECDEKENG